jgi:EAL domain-containing protein (putative c-di-GMP-specific phosphodiesterase class I)
MYEDQNQKSFKAGDIIMRQGEAGKCAYIVESGRVEILLETSDSTCQKVGTRGTGAMIGEMALIDDAPRTATIRAIEDCELLEITKDNFSQRLEKADPVLRMAMQVTLTRYRDILKRAQIIGDPPQNVLDAETQEQNYADSSNALETVKISSDFEAALESGEISLHYQPITNLQTGRIAGFEALMRWAHPERGFLPPDVFIPIIEDSGLIVKASKWALKESLSALKRIEKQANTKNDLFMSVNFSSQDFSEPDFVDSIYESISIHDIKPHQLHIEITERLLMGQPDKAQETLEMFRKAGMSISIDDFGTGYSSLSYLHAFPIDTLKIDRSFVMNMTSDKGARELVKSIIGLGKNLSMKLIAEGVEEEAESVILKELGCDMVQGYYYCRPLPEADVMSYVQDNL